MSPVTWCHITPPLALEWSCSGWKENLRQIVVIHCRAVYSTTTIHADIVHYSFFHAPLFSCCLAVSQGQPSIWLDSLPFFCLHEIKAVLVKVIIYHKVQFSGSDLVCCLLLGCVQLCLARERLHFWSGYVSLSPSATPHLRHTTHAAASCALCSQQGNQHHGQRCPASGPVRKYWLWVKWPCEFLHITTRFSSCWISISWRMQIKCGWCLWTFDWHDWCYMSMVSDREALMVLARSICKAFYLLKYIIIPQYLRQWPPVFVFKKNLK